jgi:soluble lytic murein transglycosylase-like protein
MIKFLLLLLLPILPLSSSVINFDDYTDCAGNLHIMNEEYSRARSIVEAEPHEDPAYYQLKLGIISLGEDMDSAALAHLEKTVHSDGFFAPFAYRKQGDIYLQRGNIKEAILHYRKAAHSTDMQPYSFFLYNKIDSLSQEYEDQLGEIDWITRWRRLMHAEEDIPPPDDKVNWKQMIDVAGLTQDTYAEFKEAAIEEGTLTRFLREITDTSVITEDFSAARAFEIARSLRNSGYLSGASRWLHYALKRESFSQDVSESEYLKFRTELNFELENWNNTIRWGKKYYDAYGPATPLIYYIARSYRNIGQENQAHRWYMKHVSYYPHLARSHNILWYLAWQEENRGNYDEARKAFREIRNTTQGNRFGDDAAFRIGLLYFREGRYDEAREEFSRFCDNFPHSPLYPGGHYWRGRALEAMGDTARAAQAYETAISHNPTHYYAWISEKQLDTSTGHSFSENDSSFQEAVRELTSSAGQITDSGGDSLYRRAIQLGSLGFSDETYFLIEPLMLDTSSNYEVLLKLSDLYHITGQYHESYKIIREIYYQLPAAVHNDPPVELLKRFYPDVYRPWIREASQEFSIDYYLIPAIMRQESTYHESIGSHAGALGLMQIIPPTGKLIASELNQEFRTDMLFEPKTNIIFGAYYISKRLSQFDGCKIKALASYNGGAHNVQRWVNRNSEILDDPYLFAEFIAFSETRNYVKKVLGNYWTYKALYDN